jgi:hypothetical protein
VGAPFEELASGQVKYSLVVGCRANIGFVTMVNDSFISICVSSANVGCGIYRIVVTDDKFKIFKILIQQ